MPWAIVLPLRPTDRGCAVAKRRRGSCAASDCYLIPGDSPMGYRLAARFAALGRGPPTIPHVHPPGSRSRGVDGARRPTPTSVRHADRETTAAGANDARPRRPAPSPWYEPGDGRSHRPVRRGARRCPLRLHAADAHASRTISSCSRQSRRARAALGQPVIIEGYDPPPIRGSSISRSHPTRASSRSMCNRARAGMSSSRARRIFTRRAHDCKPAPREIHARRPAYRHRRRQSHRDRRRDGRRILRFCAARICCAASSRTGTIIPRCRICSRDSSSGPPARRRASTRRATIRCTNSKSRSGKFPRPEPRCAALARRSAAPQSSDRCHRQHASRRILHRQAVFARQQQRAARPARNARLSKCRRTRA